MNVTFLDYPDTVLNEFGARGYLVRSVTLVSPQL
jgi:hypothetical protein